MLNFIPISSVTLYISLNTTLVNVKPSMWNITKTIDYSLNTTLVNVKHANMKYMQNNKRI